MITDRSTEVLDLHKEGCDPLTIARKLELSIPEVENIIYGQVQNTPQYDSWAIETMHWGAHY